ncbi:hypothetical protein MAR_005467 [Mya arenaria]|uniref:PH domain-containing protein n=1 Tax=Mya arenaria TaxID=6604 RepID=A0ABY7F1A3_MYAAR|nr:hypothetical protein MAR_005467 [Mya arenaria]
MAEFKCVDVHIDREQCFFLIFGDPEKEHIVFCCDTNRSLKKWIKKLKEAIYAFDSGIGHEEEAEESDDEAEESYDEADDRTTSNDNHGEEPQYENFGHFADQADVQTSTLKKKQANEVVDDKPGDTHDDFYENVLHGGAHKVSCEYPENDDQETHVQRRIKGGRKIGPSKTDAKMDVNTRYPIKTNSCSALETNSENATIDGSGREKKYSTVLKKGESQSMRLRINEFEQSSKSANSFGKGLSKNITSSKLKDLYENVDYPAVKNDKRAGATTK